jgi:hypothetical protein
MNLSGFASDYFFLRMTTVAKPTATITASADATIAIV